MPDGAVLANGTAADRDRGNTTSPFYRCQLATAIDIAVHLSSADNKNCVACNSSYIGIVVTTLSGGKDISINTTFLHLHFGISRNIGQRTATIDITTHNHLVAASVTDHNQRVGSDDSAGTLARAKNIVPHSATAEKDTRGVIS